MTVTQLESLRRIAQTLALARYGQTETGKPARVLTEDEHRTTMREIIALLKEDVGEKDPLPSVSWRVGSNFGDWHRQAEQDVTRCGIRVPVLTAIVGYGIASSVRPVDGCRTCWAEEPAGVGVSA